MSVAFLGLGFFLSLASYTLAGTYAFLFLGSAMSFGLFLLFFSGRRRQATWYVIGFCLATEAYGLVHLGLASALGLVLVLLYETLGERLNFTSGFIRYMIALAIALTAYAVLLFPPASLASRLLLLTALYPFIALASYLASARQKTAYELL